MEPKLGTKPTEVSEAPARKEQPPVDPALKQRAELWRLLRGLKMNNGDDVYDRGGSH